ncbi:Caprin-2 [Nibea albiflora]|uniref:Caprin-2 n=1 Tax=Nibea albiflora TaxID=240163 RepID=A0ACB7EXN0_NIBAL|nr:Caprin-2 [Nibea albiflora]
MKKIAVLLLAFCWCLCEAQVDGDNVTDSQDPGSASSCDMCSLTSMIQSLGAMEKKVTNMAEQITLLEAKLQNTGKDVLELRSLIGGIFTAMDKGMYFFRFTMFSILASVPNSVVSLMKNGERLSSVWGRPGTNANAMGSNAVVIPLEVGDNVYIELYANTKVYDNPMNYNTFSGFLLFTM